MHSKHIDVSYFAAGIVAHIVSDGDKEWPQNCIQKHEVVEDLVTIV